MSTSTGGNLNLVKPALTDDHKVTIGTDLPVNFQKIDDAFSTHLADYTLQVPYAEATGTTNIYSVTLNPAPTSLVNGLALAVKIPVDSTGASTINVNNLGAVGIKKANGADVTNLKAGGIYTLRYDGVNFILQGEGASGNATASDLLSGKTATTDAGEITGTIPIKSAATITPGTTNQVIAAGQYLAGAQTIAGSANLVSSNIKSGVNIFGVTGTLAQGAVIKSIQSGSINTPSSLATVTISPVNLSKTFLLFSYRATREGPDNNFTLGYFSNATTLTFERKYNLGNLLIEWQVIEFTSGVNVQSGQKDLQSYTGVITENINPVNRAKSFLVFSYRQLEDTENNNDNFHLLQVKGNLSADGTTLTFNRSYTPGTLSREYRVAWFVVTFD